jgi:hypothetical protein
MCGVLRVGGLHDALGIVRALTATGAPSVRLGVPSSQADQPRDWSVVLTTGRIPLTADSIRFWEEAMIDIEHRWPGTTFLGWRTRPAGPVSATASASQEPTGATTHWPASQRELVAASLLRRPVGPRRAVGQSQR